MTFQDAPTESSSSNSGEGAASERGLVYRALPEERVAPVYLTPPAKPQIAFPGRMILRPEMKSALKEHAESLWFPHNAEAFGSPQWVINYLADGDVYRTGLSALSEMLKRRPARVFNHPDAVLNTRRDLSAAKLKDVENLICPTSLRFRPKHPNDFLKVFEIGKFEYPVLIRLAGTHNADDLLKIDNRGDWDKVFTIPWGGNALYMSQWTDFQRPDGEWRKIRLALTPDAVRVRHVLLDDNWLLRGLSYIHREGKRTPEMVEREVAAIEEAQSSETLRRVGEEIRERVGLDFCGVDLGWKSDTEFVLFEANISMSILIPSMESGRRNDFYADILETISQDVWRALENTVSFGLR